MNDLFCGPLTVAHPMDRPSIVRIAPDGKIDRVVEMPAQNITTCTFGGPDRRTLYVTTAKIEAPARDRLAGGLFAIKTEIAGQPENQFRAFGARP